MGGQSHAEGAFTIASGEISHAQGGYTEAQGDFSHSQGAGTLAQGDYSHAGGQNTKAIGLTSFVHGYNSQANGDYSIVLGRNITGNTNDTTYVDNFNIKSVPIGTSINNLGIDINGRVVVGSAGGTGSTTSYWSASTGTNAIVTINNTNIASGANALAEGRNTLAGGDYSHSEGRTTQANGGASHAEGYFSEANGEGSHAEGGSGDYGGGIANGDGSHAEGVSTVADGDASHAEGEFTEANGIAAHAEGSGTIAQGDYTHAGGNNSQAIGIASFVHGDNSIVNGNYSIVLGQNITGNTANTTYVDNLNIKTVGSSPSVNDIRIDAAGNLTTNTSDIRFKENITNINGGLNKIKQLQGVNYQWKDRVAGGDNIKLGFIAQAVEEVEPNLVFTNKNDGYKGIHIDGIIPLLVEAVKELSSGITTEKNTYLETQTILAEDNNIELNYKGTHESSIDGGVTILRGDEQPTTLLIDSDGNWVSNVNILSEGFIIPEYTPTNSQDSKGVVGNIVQDDNYIYIKRSSGWKRTTKLEDF